MNKRYDSIDIIKGLCLIWIIWYHTDHPLFVDYPFFNTTLFFLSGVVFHSDDWSIFVKKRLKSYVFPFIVFYLVYYVFLMGLNFISLHTIPNEIITSISGIFGLYTYNGAFIVNYPLWFVLALLNIQLIVNLILKTKIHKYAILLISISISIIAYYYIRQIPTPLMFGRSLPYLLFFVIGYFYGKATLDLLYYHKHFIIAIVLWLVFMYFHYVIDISFILIPYIEMISFAFVLLFGVRYLEGIERFTKIFIFVGRNSFIVMGMHEIYLTVLRILFTHIYGEMNFLLGGVSVIITLLLLYPTIILCNKFLPFGKSVDTEYKIRS